MFYSLIISRRGQPVMTANCARDLPLLFISWYTCVHSLNLANIFCAFSGSEYTFQHPQHLTPSLGCFIKHSTSEGGYPRNRPISCGNAPSLFRCLTSCTIQHSGFRGSYPIFLSMFRACGSFRSFLS